MSFKAEGLAFLDSAISLSNKQTQRELISNLKGLSEENKLKDIFISVDKDCKGNIILLCKKKFGKDASTMAVYLSAVIAKEYSNFILLIFKLCF